MKNTEKGRESNGIDTGSAAVGKASNAHEMQASQLMKLFEEQLGDILWAEKALTKAIPKMIKNATSTDLKDALTAHLMETEQHIDRVEEVFAMIGKKPHAEKCEAMNGLIKEAGEIMDACEDGSMCDAGIIIAAQKIEHYEIATYGTLREFAETLDLTNAVEILQETLNEEKAADEKLTQIATNTVNSEAAESIA